MRVGIIPAEGRTFGYRLVKRILDLVLALTVAMLFLPVFICVAFLAIIFHGFPILYVSPRHISVDEQISIFKFRTMVKDANSPKYQLKERFMRNGYLDIPPDCEVFTPFGRLLERTQLVELPQVFNIIVHGMSWIGNRPLPSSNHSLLEQHQGWESRYQAPCGITGISQIVGKLNLEPRQRIELESLYALVYQNGNILRCDFVIACATAKLILFDIPTDYDNARELLRRCL